MPVDRFMSLALGHPAHGYYMTRDPLGLEGDFVTAPEISQMFGELIGLFAALCWQALGSPTKVALVELGPGRGTLMRDALRAARVLPGFLDAIEVHLVETSPVLRQAQRATLSESAVLWRAEIGDLPGDRPLIVLANEFFDALPVRQFVRRSGRWHERVIGQDRAGALAFGLAPAPVEGLSLDAPDGTLFETSPLALDRPALDGRAAGRRHAYGPRDGLHGSRRLAGRLLAQKGVLLAIDYGAPRSGFGETLQAVRAHRFVPVLDHPGEADLTAHVDFEALGRAAARAGLSPSPLLTQASLLERLGIHHRAAILKRNAADPSAIEADVARLCGEGPDAMGGLFKALALAHGLAGSLPAFDAPDPRLAL